jgi:cystathionine beta-lyase/cystathionine gamma-synthase
MIQQNHSPLEWLQEWAMHMGWPAVCLAAFMLGRYVKHLEHRLTKSEERLEKLAEDIRTMMERHLPAIHNGLAHIRGLLMGGKQ